MKTLAVLLSTTLYMQLSVLATASPATTGYGLQYLNSTADEWHALSCGNPRLRIKHCDEITPCVYDQSRSFPFNKRCPNTGVVQGVWENIDEATTQGWGKLAHFRGPKQVCNHTYQVEKLGPNGAAVLKKIYFMKVGAADESEANPRQEVERGGNRSEG